MKDSKATADWIGIDATQSPPVAYIHDTAGSVTDRITLTDLSAQTLGTALAAYLGDAKPTPVLCTGAPWLLASDFAAVPSIPLAGLAQIDMPDPRITLLALPGLQQKHPRAVMQGDETMIAGLLAQQPSFDGVALTIGATTSWSHISAGEIVSFQSFLTPELGEKLGEQLNAIEGASDPLAKGDFDAAVDAMLSRPQNFAAALAELQAAARLGSLSAAARYARLAGSLIGIELAAARPYWLGQQVAIIGAAPAAPLYQHALMSQGVMVQMQDATEMIRAGLAAALARHRSPS